MGKVGSRQFRKLNLKTPPSFQLGGVFGIIYNMDDQILTSEQNATHSGVTSKWAKKRKFFYIFIFVGILLIFSVFPLFKLFYTPPSCFDNKQNQEEVGVDCGGSCQGLCKTQVTDIVVKWADVFKVNEDVYSVAANIENPNRTAGVDNMFYKFEIYDNNGLVIGERSGNTFIKSRDRFIIFEPNIRIENGSIPISTDIVFEESPVWEVSKRQNIPIIVKNKKLINAKTHPRLTATLLNDTVEDIFDIDVASVVYNSEDEPIAVSSTFVDIIERNSQKDIFFTWPAPFTSVPEAGCTAPVDAMLVFDRSGSMGFASSNPPQPLTEAKAAALAFVENMQGVDQIGLVSFATEASYPIDQGLTKLHDKVKEAIASISILSPSKKQHTNLGDGIEKATLELLSERNDQNAKKAMIILTDGSASRPLNPENRNDPEYPDNYARDKAGRAWDSDISIYVIGLGDMVNEEFLKNRIVSSPDSYFKASTTDELKSIYNEIAQAVCKEETFVTDIVVHIKDTGSNI